MKTRENVSLPFYSAMQTGAMGNAGGRLLDAERRICDQSK